MYVRNASQDSGSEVTKAILISVARETTRNWYSGEPAESRRELARTTERILVAAFRGGVM